MCWPSMCWARPAPRRLMPMRCLRKCAPRRLTPISRARTSMRWWISSPPAATRCAPMTAMRGCARPKTALAPGASSAGPGIPPQCRGDRGRPDGGDPAAEQGPAGGRGRPQAGRAGGIFRRTAFARRHLRLRRQCAALRGPARNRRLCHQGQRSTKRKSPATMAASFRFPLSWPSGCARWSARPATGTSCPSRCRNG